MSEQVLPFYLVCDESYSMAGEPLEEINKQLPEIFTEIASNPTVADKARLGIIGFGDRAEVLLPLADLNDVHQLPHLEPKGATSYSAVFTRLRDTIEQDIQELKADGHVPFRPTVFFLTDGQPTDHDWAAAHQRLTAQDFGPRPTILAFGFGEVRPETLQAVATFRAFIADGELSPSNALREFAKQLLNSVVASAVSSSAAFSANPTASAQMVFPEQVKGYTVLEANPV
ncbi:MULTISPECIES: vWA domain-containing protein [Actinomadura]|uniref:VWA domain-containing protein n=1 Tax=Actinomadura yumaensis TaxID=111807 RepID=A0ABW2CIM2_9ACTN|nr:VWA domain-containing protein [Actinomadura sp. J1-007]MWK37063.1 VWA domain-containing protein [Actinomadura sp. J1-007]